MGVLYKLGIRYQASLPAREPQTQKDLTCTKAVEKQKTSATA